MCHGYPIQHNRIHALLLELLYALAEELVLLRMVSPGQGLIGVRQILRHRFDSDAGHRAPPNCNSTNGQPVFYEGIGAGAGAGKCDVAWGERAEVQNAGQMKSAIGPGSKIVFLSLAARRGRRGITKCGGFRVIHAGIVANSKWEYKFFVPAVHSLPPQWHNSLSGWLIRGVTVIAMGPPS